MSFFEPPPVLDEPPEHVPPPWLQPPRDVLAALVPDRRILARTAAVAVLLSHVDVYPTGCQFRLRVAARRPVDMDLEDWWNLRDVLFDGSGRRHARQATAGLPDEVPRFGVQFSDGTKATTTGAFPGAPLTGTPEGPVLFGHGGGGGGSEYDVAMNWPLWLWPLPPREDFDLVVEWPALGITMTRTKVDGRAINEAAQRTEGLFGQR